MTPKEKATQLFAKYYGIPLYIKTVKECCYISINELVEADWFIQTEKDREDWLTYWQEVKHEIEKL